MDRTRKIRLAILFAPLLAAASSVAQVAVQTGGTDLRRDGVSDPLLGGRSGVSTPGLGGPSLGSSGVPGLGMNLFSGLQPFSPDHNFGSQFLPKTSFNPVTNDPIGVGNLGFGGLNLSPFSGGAISDPTRIDFGVPAMGNGPFQVSQLGAIPGYGQLTLPGSNPIDMVTPTSNISRGFLPNTGVNLSLPIDDIINSSLQSNIAGQLQNPSASFAPPDALSYEEDLIAASPLFGAGLNTARRSTTRRGHPMSRFITNEIPDDDVTRALRQSLTGIESAMRFGQPHSEARAYLPTNEELINAPTRYQGLFGGQAPGNFNLPTPKRPASVTPRVEMPSVVDFLKELKEANDEQMRQVGVSPPDALQSPAAGTQHPASKVDTSLVRPAPPSGLSTIPTFDPSGNVYEDMQAAMKWIKSLRGQQEALAMAAEQVPELGASFDRAISYVLNTAEHPLNSLTGDADAPSAKRAEEYLKAGEYYRALAHFEMAQALDRNNPLLDLGQGHALFGAGEYFSAVLRITRGIERFPDIAHFKFDLRQLITDLELLDERRAELERRLTGQEDYRYRFLLGYVEYYMGLTKFGLENLKQAAADAPALSVIARFPAILASNITLIPDAPEEEAAP